LRTGVFTPLLSSFSLEDVQEAGKLDIRTVELGTGNYPGDPHCNLSMLESQSGLKDFKAKLADHGFSISALSCHGNPCTLTLRAHCTIGWGMSTSMQLVLALTMMPRSLLWR